VVLNVVTKSAGLFLFSILLLIEHTLWNLQQVSLSDVFEKRSKLSSVAK